MWDELAVVHLYRSLEAVSYGSARLNIDGTCGLCLAINDINKPISAGARVPGSVATHNSFQSELSGLYGILSSVCELLVRAGPGQPGQVTVASDT